MSLSDTTRPKRGHPSPMMFVSLGLGTVLAVALIIVVSILTGGTVKTHNGQPEPAIVGESVKGFTTAGLKGATVSSPWTSGHASVLIFFASWCGPCKAEMPEVAAYLRTHDEGSVKVVGVDSNDVRSAALKFVAKDRVTFPVAFDPNFVVASEFFASPAIPFTVFVSATGVVKSLYLGAIPTTQLASGIAALRRL